MFDNKKRAFIAISGTKEICLIPGMANRHGLITGATGTGKTVTLQNLAETFSAMGVPVFAADVKGDLSGVASRGGATRTVWSSAWRNINWPKKASLSRHTRCSSGIF